MRKFSNERADVFVPDGAALPGALERTTHLAVGAHQDDLEIMAYHGVAECYGRSSKWFTGVVATDGAGSPRAGIYGDYSDEQMQAVRHGEQRKAAVIGEYAGLVQLMHRSSQVKDPAFSDVVTDLTAVLDQARPEVLYVHNPADKHDTHVAVTLRVLQAVRALPSERRPARVYGCEVWRDLDWTVDADKAVLPVDAHPNVAASLLGVFDSQISGGKRYDLAAAGRRLANATFFESHAVDTSDALTFALDLTALFADDDKDPFEAVATYIDHFKEDVKQRITKLGGEQKS